MASLDALRRALLTVGLPTYHYFGHRQEDQYLVWAESGQGNGLCGDDKMMTQAIAGSVDYFTRAENDPKVAAIQVALNDAYIAYRLNSVQHEDDTGYTHYEWIFEVDTWQG